MLSNVWGLDRPPSLPSQPGALRCSHAREALAWPTCRADAQALGGVWPVPAGASSWAVPELLWPDRAAKEEWVVTGPVREGVLGCVTYRCDGHWIFGTACMDDRGEGLQQAAWRAYADLFKVLERESCPHLQRVWNYLRDINAEEAGLERYRLFNLGRARAFEDVGRGLEEGAPAACAMGTTHGSLTVHFLAGRRAPLPIENPRQVSAYHYPRQYGPRSPTFSRAALADLGAGVRVLFISGTASIVGHESLHPGDVVRQARECLHNIDAVLTAALPAVGAAWTVEALRDRLECTVYLRRPGDLAAVRDVVCAWLGPSSPAARAALYMKADVCRAELLVEIEAQVRLADEELP
jgi:enamine deaminase RidA (YjgF/YER057c/UK114 family)